MSDSVPVKYKILLCEDDFNLGKILKDFFELNEFSVTLEKEGRMGLIAFRREKFDICLLDVMMPNMDGFQLAEEIRNINTEVPLFFLTAKNLKEDLMKGYNLRADDYITKPFDIDVLLMKVRSVIQRQQNKQNLGNVERMIVLGKYVYDTHIRSLSFNGIAKYKLSPTESSLLVLLYQYRDTVLNRDVALRKIWGTDTYFNSRSMDVYITRLRKYFVEDKRVEIVNLYSTGFKLNIP